VGKIKLECYIIQFAVGKVMMKNTVVIRDKMISFELISGKFL